jgi:hypothetical protein
MNVLCPRHVEHLVRFRIPLEMLETAGVRSVGDTEALRPLPGATFEMRSQLERADFRIRGATLSRPARQMAA